MKVTKASYVGDSSESRSQITRERNHLSTIFRHESLLTILPSLNPGWSVQGVIILPPSFNYPRCLGDSMRCSHCEKCCEDTQMELCNADIARLERRGHHKDDFSCRGADGTPRLRNVGAHCFFYDHDRKRCKEYASRPLGCVIYPVNLTPEGEVVIDSLCPEADTLTQDEIESKGRRLRLLLDTIDLEARESTRSG